MYSFNAELHAHSFKGRPLIGTTTALSVISKPLTYWASGMAVAEMGWINPKLATLKECQDRAETFHETIKKMSTMEYVQLLNRAYKAHSKNLKKTAGEGVDLHSSVEDFVRSKIDGNPLMFPDERIKTFIEWSEKNVKQFLFTEIYLYSEELWVGGIADFSYLDMNGDLVLGDIKSSKDAYFSHFVQCGGYNIQLAENKGGFDANGKKIFELTQPIKYHAIFPFGKGFTEPVINMNTERDKRSFISALTLYKEMQAFEGK